MEPGPGPRRGGGREGLSRAEDKAQWIMVDNAT